MTAAEPIRERVTVYRCPFCRRSRSRRAPAVKHARHCFKNPERMPREGELTSVGQTGRLVDWGESSALPGGMSWLEWDEHETMPPWWPGVGKVFDGAVWRDVPGYSVGRETGAHGCAGGAPPLDVWPLLDGVPLDECVPGDRLRILESK